MPTDATPTLTPIARAFLTGVAECIERGDTVDLDQWSVELAAAIRQALAVVDAHEKCAAPSHP